jgi:hypothetical protein
LAFVGLVTFDRALQSGIEDFGYAQRIARLRGHYFQHAPEPVDYLLSVPPAQRLQIQGMHGGRWQRFLTVAGMVGVITAVLTGPAAGLLAAIATDHSLVAALGVGAGVAVAARPGCCVSSGQHGNGSARRHRSPTCKQPESRGAPERTEDRQSSPKQHVAGSSPARATNIHCRRSTE